MQTYTPVRRLPAATSTAAAEALKRLSEADSALSAELAELPKPPQTLLAALNSNAQNPPLDELLQQIDAYWRAPSASGKSRRVLFASLLRQSIKNEALLKSHENVLQPNAVSCLPTPDSAQVPSLASAHALHVTFSQGHEVEIKGALVLGIGSGRTLLALPGSGLTEYPTRLAMRETVAQWLNDKTLRRALLINVDQRDQDDAFTIADDPDLYLDAFTADDVRLQAIPGNPYQHALKRQIDKQAEDVRYRCTDGVHQDSDLRRDQIDGAIRMADLWRPSGMLERREQVIAEQRLRGHLPYWLKIATAQDREEYVRRLKRYDQARLELASVLNGADSAQAYAHITVRTALANDLGYDLDPATISLSTQRTLPITGENYTTTRTLTAQALYGLHPDDQKPGSDFLTRTTVSIDGQPLGNAHASLTPAYLATMITDLSLRTRFGDYQRTTYAQPANRMLMRDVLKLQIEEAACAAKMQGHITQQDFDLVAAMTSTAVDDTRTLAQVRVDNLAALAGVLVFKKDNAQGGLERLVVFTSHAPREQQFQGFDTQTQLLNELVSWTAKPALSDYLLEQVPASARATLLKTLTRLSEKPQPNADFIALQPLEDYTSAMSRLVDGLIDVTLSNQKTHTPDWYLNASVSQRQKLVALEDAVAGAIGNYHGHAHTHVQAFEDYVHQRASEKINQLLGADGSVDPDHIVITTERETLTYTQMIRNGYDDSLGLLNATADTVATFSGPEDVDLSALTPASVAGSVRGKWLSDAYAALVRSTLLAPASSGYEYRRNASTLITQLQMQAAALRSLLKGDIDEFQYQWLAPAIDNLHRSDAESRRRYPVYPLQIHVDKPFIASHLGGIDQLVIAGTDLTHVETVQGCHALLPTHNRLGALLYTPDAADGIEFRAFATFVDSLGEPGMIDYYKDRCRIKSRRVLSFFLNDMKDGNANKAPFIPKDSIADFAEVCFNRPIERKLRDADETTTSRSNMLASLLWNSIETIATVLTLPFPPASFAVGIALSLGYGYKAIQALASEAPEQANMLIMASVLNLAGAAGDLSAGLKGFGGAARNLARQTRHAAQPAALKPLSNLPQPKELYPVDLLDEPFLVTKPTVEGRAAVFRMPGDDAAHVRATGQHAVRNNSTGWQPLGHSPTSPSAASAAVSADRVVDIALNDFALGTGHASGVRIGINGRYYIQMNGLAYQVQYDTSLRCWQIVDPNNPYAFFGRQSVRRDEQGQWQLLERSGLRGGGKDDAASFKPLTDEAAGSETAGRSVHDYELPKKLQPHMDDILSNQPVDPMAMGMEEYFELFYQQLRRTYNTLRENLYRDATAFFADSVALAPRPALPTVDASTTISDFFKAAFANSNGLVLSETAKSVASKQLLILNMQALADEGVKVLYIEHLFTDKHLPKLAKYFSKGSKIRAGSHEIKDHLRLLNDGALDNASSEFDYYHVIKHAHRHNIEVRPLNSSVSYPIDAHPVVTAAGDDAVAQKMSNYFAHKVIQNDIAAKPDTRWVALIDETRATTHREVAGIAELEGAISVQVDAARPGQLTRISENGRLVATTDTPLAVCDFKLELGEAASTETLTTPVTQILPGTSNAGTLVDNAPAAGAGFRWVEGSGWQPVAAAEWLADSTPTALQQSFADPLFEMPSSTKDTLYQLAYHERRGLDEGYMFSDPELAAVREQMFDKRSKLQAQASQIDSVQLPARPTMPDIDPQPGSGEFIQRLYQESDAMVLGEFHTSIGSKKFIIDNLPLLAQQDVKTLYMEHLLTDLHQLDLDRFVETGQMSKKLLHSLRTLDKGHMTDPAGVYTFEKLVIEAQRNGLDIRAIDCAASYHLKGLRHETVKTRQQMMNFFASRTIRRHQAIMGSHKWVALVGNSHSNTFANTVPGLAELEGAIGLRVVDVSPGAASGIALDEGESALLPMSNKTMFIKGDFKLAVEVVRSPSVIRAPQPLPVEQRLWRPGLFVTEQQGDVHTIIHRSRDQVIHRTPVQQTDAGKVFVDRPAWTAVHLQPYDDIDELIVALEDINLTRVA